MKFQPQLSFQPFLSHKTNLRFIIFIFFPPQTLLSFSFPLARWQIAKRHMTLSPLTTQVYFVTEASFGSNLHNWSLIVFLVFEVTFAVASFNGKIDVTTDKTDIKR